MLTDSLSLFTVLGNSDSVYHDELVEKRVDVDIGPMLANDRRLELKTHPKWTGGVTRSNRERMKSDPGQRDEATRWRTENWKKGGRRGLVHHARSRHHRRREKFIVTQFRHEFALG